MQKKGKDYPTSCASLHILHSTDDSYVTFLCKICIRIKIDHRRFMIKKRGKRPSKHLIGRRFQIQKKREIKKTLCRQPA